MSNIKQVQGDLLDYFERGECEVIAHCCNCQGVMGSGIALTIKNKYIEAYDAYKAYQSQHGLVLGTISKAYLTASKLIINLHAQRMYGSGSRFVDYEAMYKSLLLTRDTMTRLGFKTIGVPYKMGCDRAGGDWRIIEAMLNVVFEGFDFNVIVVEYTP